MTSKDLQERILRTCYEFMNADSKRHEQVKDAKFFTEFKTFVKQNSFENLLRRGCGEDLKRQWSQGGDATETRELHKILQGDEL